jgi:hypothetical protein
MSLRRIQLLFVAVVLSTLLFASGPAGGSSAVGNAAPPIKFTFEGCWTQFSAGPCRDVFRDDQGNYWICRDCGTTGNPNSNKCHIISQAQLNTGFWCS